MEGEGVTDAGRPKQPQWAPQEPREEQPEDESGWTPETAEHQPVGEAMRTLQLSSMVVAPI